MRKQGCTICGPPGAKASRGGPQKPLTAPRISPLSSVLTGAAFLAIPKCPICLAVYLTAVTGIGVSASVVRYAKAGLAVMCVALLLASMLKYIPGLTTRADAKAENRTLAQIIRRVTYPFV